MMLNRARCLMRSIPARTGEPSRERTRWTEVRPNGLSPRVRGNPALHMELRVPMSHGSIPARTGEPVVRLTSHATAAPGSIPARTGEPSPSANRSSPGRTAVYPRAYGGTDGDGRPGLSLTSRYGLSPRVRGNLQVSGLSTDAAQRGSIPARTGEPREQPRPLERARHEVYPRAYGGTPSYVRTSPAA